MTRLLLVLAAALVAAPAALADGPMPYSQQGTGVLSADGAVRYVAVGAALDRSTVLEAISTRDGSIRNYNTLPGSYGVPTAVDGVAGTGLSTDGKTLVLGDVAYGYPRKTSAFTVVAVPSLRVLTVFALRGDFAFDALSPDGARLYLVQHVDAQDQSRYVVRAYDIPTLTLLPGRVADRTQKSWVMRGNPVSRATSANGRFVYTLYSNPGGVPFVHALDTVKGVAHCVGLPWRGSDNAVYNMRLALHGSSLAVHFASGRRWLRVDTTTWRLSPDRASFPWWTLWLLALVPLAVLAVRARSLRLPHDRAPGADEVVQDPAGARRGGARHRRLDRDGRDGGAARPEWRGQVDDARHGARAAAAGRGDRLGLRRLAAPGRGARGGRRHAADGRADP